MDGEEFFKNLFGGKKQKREEIPIPATDTQAVQEATAQARRLAALAKGKQSTDIVSRLGDVGRA